MLFNNVLMALELGGVEPPASPAPFSGQKKKNCGVGKLSNAKQKTGFEKKCSFETLLTDSSHLERTLLNTFYDLKCT